MPTRYPRKRNASVQQVKRKFALFGLLLVFLMFVTGLVMYALNRQTFTDASAAASMAIITVPPKAERKQISKYIWGVNYEGFNQFSSLGTDTSTNQYDLYSRISKTKLRELGATIIRVPGGWPAYFYDYKNERMSYRTGTTNVIVPFLSIPEMRQLATDMGAEILYQMNVGLSSTEKSSVHNGYPNITPTVEDAAAIVRTHTTGTNPIRYFQITNENSLFMDSHTTHLNKATNYARAMKTANPNIKILLDAGFGNDWNAWSSAAKGAMGNTATYGCGANSVTPCFDYVSQNYLTAFSQFNSYFGVGKYAITEWSPASACWRDPNPYSGGTSRGFSTLQRLMSMTQNDVFMANYHDLALRRDSCSLFVGKSAFSPSGFGFSMSAPLAGGFRTNVVNNGMPAGMGMYAALSETSAGQVLRLLIINTESVARANVTAELSGVMLRSGTTAVKAVRETTVRYDGADQLTFVDIQAGDASLPKVTSSGSTGIILSTVPRRSIVRLDIPVTDQGITDGFGLGLKGNYTQLAPDGASLLSESTVTRVDPTINFSTTTWAKQPILSSFTAPGFQVEWNGIIAFPAKRTYQLQLAVNEEAELWIGNTQVIKRTAVVQNGVVSYQGAMTGNYAVPFDPLTTALKDYPRVRIVVKDKSGVARAQLYWRTSSTATWGIIANRYLRYPLSDSGTGTTTPSATGPVELQVEDMVFSGPYATGPTVDGGMFYANGDQAVKTVELPGGAGSYTFALTGRTTTSTPASIELYAGGTKVGRATFASTSPTTVTLPAFAVSGSSVELRLALENDTGANDTFVDKIVISKQ